MAAAQFALALQRLRARVASSPLMASAVQTMQLLAPDYHTASATYNRFAQIVTSRDDSMPPLWPMLQPIGMAGPSIFLPSESSATDDAEEATKEEWEEGTWFAVPKRKTSYRRKRMRQMNPLYQNTDAQHFYPCPKCDKGLLKLRHHLCPCDQDTINAKSVVKVKYGVAGQAPKPNVPAAAAGAAEPEKPAEKE